jgi:hypothetical protein
MSAPKISPTADPRVRIACHGARNWRTEVQDSVDNEIWYITGPPYESRAVALACVDGTVSRHFGEPTHDALRTLRAQVERLTAEKAELAEKLSHEKDRATALYVDGDRREQRALALLPDCEAHRRELQYLRHCVSEYWHAMNDSDQARRAIVSANQLTARNLSGGGPDATVKAADVATWLMRNVDKQDKALKRHVFPTQADCLRSAAGGCEHESICDDVKADIAEVLGLVLADAPARCKAAKR